jgi:hypothetical protein
MGTAAACARSSARALAAGEFSAKAEVSAVAEGARGVVPGSEVDGGRAARCRNSSATSAWRTPNIKRALVLFGDSDTGKSVPVMVA